MPSETAASRDRRQRRRRRRPTSTMTLSAAHSASPSSPIGTTISLALLLLVSDLTGKLPPSAMAERRRFYSRQNYRQRSRSAHARRDKQRRQKRADGAPSSDQQMAGPIRRMQDGEMGDKFLYGLFGEEFQLTVKDSTECEECADCVDFFGDEDECPSSCIDCVELPPPYNEEFSPQALLDLVGDMFGDLGDSFAESSQDGFIGEMNLIPYSDECTSGKEDQGCGPCEPCGDDEDCADGLSCYERPERDVAEAEGDMAFLTVIETVPGCTGEAQDWENLRYCYDPVPVMLPTVTSTNGVIGGVPPRPGNMQPDGFDADGANANGLFLLTPGGTGDGEDLLTQLFGEDFELTERDPGECETCEGCLQCISCVDAASDDVKCIDCDRCSSCLGCVALPEPFNGGLSPEGILDLVGIGNDKMADSSLKGEELLKILFGEEFELSIRNSPECGECSDCSSCIGCLGSKDEACAKCEGQCSPCLGSGCIALPEPYNTEGLGPGEMLELVSGMMTPDRSVSDSPVILESTTTVATMDSAGDTITTTESVSLYLDTASFNEFVNVGTCNSGSNKKCKECEGSCERNRDCKGDLKCLKRDGDESVPGCFGEPMTGENYCYDPAAESGASGIATVVEITEDITYSQFRSYQDLGTVNCMAADGVTQIRGYDRLSNLRRQLEAGRYVVSIPGDQIPEEGLIYSICPGSTLTFLEVGGDAAVLPPLRITSNHTTLRCGQELEDGVAFMDEEASRCTLADGLNHLLVEPGLEKVNVERLYFANTRELGNSVIVQKHPRTVESQDEFIIVGRAMPVNFVDCTWEGNRGSSALGVQRLSSTDMPSASPSMATDEPTVETDEPTIDTDEPTRRPTRRPTRFRRPTPTPTMEPTFTPLPTVDDWCFTDWELLAEAVATQPRGSTFYICPNTVMDLRTDFTQGSHPVFYIKKSKTVIKCGLTGRRSNTCLIYGNTEHFVFVNQPRNVVIEGLTMMETNGVASIIAAGDERASATFIDCAWWRNEGRAVVLVANGLYASDTEGDDVSLGAGRQRGAYLARYGSAFAPHDGRRLQGSTPMRADFEDIPPPPEGGSMTVKFENCVFRSNIVEYSVITNWGGRTVFDRSYFRGNRAGSTVIGGYYDAEVSASTSCFIENDASYPGTIFIRGATLDLNIDNYADGNEVGDCQDIWLADDCPNPDDVDECQGICEPYTEITCPLNPLNLIGMNQAYGAINSDDIDKDIVTMSPSPTVATASPTVASPSPTEDPIAFLQGRTYDHLMALVEDENSDPNPRVTCTAGYSYAVDYVVAQMESLGLIPLGDAGRTSYENIVPGSIDVTYCPDGMRNVIGMVAGATRPDEYIIYSAHLDGPNNQNPQTQETRGNQDTSNAYDDGTAVALGLAMAEQMTKNPQARSVIFLFDDGKEGWRNVGIPPLGESLVCSEFAESTFYQEMPVNLAKFGGEETVPSCRNFPIGFSAWIQEPTIDLSQVKAAYFADPLGVPPNGEGILAAIGGEMSRYGGTGNMNTFLDTVWPEDSDLALTKVTRKAAGRDLGSIDSATIDYEMFCGTGTCISDAGFPAVWLAQPALQKYHGGIAIKRSKEVLQSIYEADGLPTDAPLPGTAYFTLDNLASMEPDDLENIVGPIYELLVNTANSDLVDNLAYNYPGLDQYTFTESDVNNAIDAIGALEGQNTFPDEFISVYSSILEDTLADLEEARVLLADGNSQVQDTLKLLLPQAFDLITIVDFFSTAYPEQESYADQIINSPVMSEGGVNSVFLGDEEPMADEMEDEGAATTISPAPTVTMLPTPVVTTNSTAMNPTMTPSPTDTMQPTPAESANTTTTPSPTDTTQPTPAESANATASPAPTVTLSPTDTMQPATGTFVAATIDDDVTTPPSMAPSLTPSLNETMLPTPVVGTNSTTSPAPTPMTTSNNATTSPAPTTTMVPTPIESSNSTSTFPPVTPTPTVTSSPTDTMQPTERTERARRSLQAFTEESFGETADISLLRCSFKNNLVTGSVVSGDGGRLDVIDSTFDNNEALDSMVASFRGMLSVERSCFQDNDHDTSNGVVFVGPEAFLGERVDNYGDGNTADIVLGDDLPTSGICNAILVKEGVSCGILPSETCRDRCIPFDSDTCVASTGGGVQPKGICSTDPNTEGYSDLLSLQQALDDSVANGTGDATTFVLCPFTTYSFVDKLNRPLDPIRIERSDVKIQCGADGASTNGCIFAGGSRHLEIYNGSLDVVIQGLRFVGSTEVSVTVDGSDSATSASFIDSHWQENEGTENLLIRGPGMGEGPLPGPDDGGRGEDSVEPTSSPTVSDDDALFPPDDDAVDPTASPTENGGGGMDDDLPTDDFFNFDGRYLQGEECGTNVCGTGEYCCNESCSICAPDGDFCIMLDCSDAGVSVQILGGSSFVDNAVAKSVVVNDGGDLQLHETVFLRNEALDNVVSTIDGVVTITDSSFQDNRHTATTGVVFVDSDSTLMRNDNNFGLDNEDAGGVDPKDDHCGGIFVAASSCEAGSDDCEGSCDKFKAKEPPIAPPCISVWDDLVNSIRTANAADRGASIIICPSTEFVLSTGENEDEATQPVMITTSGIKIMCGQDGLRDNECTIRGGYDHFVLGGTEMTVEFSGLTMKASTGLASVIAAADSQSEAIFTDCLWVENDGSSVITIYNQAGRNGYEFVNPRTPDAERSVFDILPPTQGSMKVTLNFCDFTDNVVDQAVIMNARGDLSVSDCRFNSNEGQASAIGVFHDGSLSLTKSCFDGNSGEITGSVFIETSGSSLYDAKDNFGKENSVGSTGICDDISLGSCDPLTSSCTGDSSVSCEEFDSTTCLASDYVPGEPTDTPSFEPTQAPGPGPPPSDCFATWEDLQVGLVAAGLFNDPVVTLCPDTVFEVPPSSPIAITVSRTTIKCGITGSRTNKCTILGGEEGAQHFVIRDSVADVMFAGLTMVGAKSERSDLSQVSASIIAEGTSSSTATFIDCEWAGNTGSAVVIITAPEVGEDDGTRETERRARGLAVSDDIGLPTFRGRAMTVSFRYCLFSDNDVTFGVVTNLAGKANFFDTQFLGNKAIGTTILNFFDAFVSLQNSCFVDSERNVPQGTVFIEDGSSLGSNSDNYGVGDIVGQTAIAPEGGNTCSDIFLEGVCVDSSATCNGFCDEFTATSCRAAEAPLDPLTPTPTPPGDCFSDWVELSNAIKINPSSEFVVCSDTAFDVGAEDPIVLGASQEKPTTLKCGEDGHTKNKCIIKGGSMHFEITGSTILAGFTLEASTRISVLVSGDAADMVKFSRCRWNSNKGAAAVMTYNEELGESIQAGVSPDDLTRPSGSSAGVEFEYCHFSANDVSFGEVVAFGAEVKVDFTAFSGNEAGVGSVVMLAGAAGSFAEGALYLSNSCFLDNTAVLPGTVFLEDDANINVLANTRNFGIDNKITSGNSCTEVFLEREGSCLEDVSTCSGICMSFQEDECNPEVIEIINDGTGANTTAPTIAPTPAPNGGGKNLGVKPISYGQSGIFLRSLLIGLFLLFGGIGSFIYLNKKLNKNGKSVAYSSVPSQSRGRSILEKLRFKKKKKQNTIADNPAYEEDDDGLEDGI